MKRSPFPPLRRVSLTAAVFCLLAALAALLVYRSREADLLADRRAQTRAIARAAAAKLDADLAKFVPVTRTIAVELSRGTLAGTAEIEARLRALLESNPNYEGCGIAFAPEAVGGGRFARYCYRLTSSVEMLAIESRYDYAAGGNLFYDKPMKDGAGWLEPHYTRATRQLVAEYAEPFERVRPDGTPYRAGIVFLNYAMNGVRRLIGGLDLGQTGYAFLVSREGAFIAHPVDEWVRTHKTLADLSREQKIPQLDAFAKELAAGRPAKVSYANELTGQTAWICGEPIPSTGWSLGVVFFEDEVHVDVRTRRSALLDILMLAVLGLVLLLFSRLPDGAFTDPEMDDDLWRLSAALTVVLTLAILLSWWVINSGEHDERGVEPPILNRAALESTLERHRARSEKMRLPAPLFVPTGLFVKSLEFTGSNTVRVTGYVWQKFTDGVHDGVKRGVLFPEADATDRFDEAYRTRDGATETVGWYFEMTLRQTFDYVTYPFDQENIWIQMRPVEFWRNIMLTPDLASYPVISPETKPGVEKEFVLSGWTLDATFFDYETAECNTRFGLTGEAEPAQVPDLYFNLLVRRSFLNPFVTDVLPLAVVFVMLFVTLLSVTRDASTNELLGFSANTLIATCAAFFFAVLLAHTQLRDRLQIPHFIYIEFFYFISYATLLAVSLDGLMCAFPERFPLLVRRDNLIAKLLFFPFSLVLLYLATLFTFR